MPRWGVSLPSGQPFGDPIAFIFRIHSDKPQSLIPRAAGFEPEASSSPPPLVADAFPLVLFSSDPLSARQRRHAPDFPPLGYTTQLLVL